MGGAKFITIEEERKTERVIRQVNKQPGELGDKFGSFTEGMAFPSMEKILRNHFKMDVVTLRAKSRQNGHSIEIDVMAYDNGSRNEVYLVEVKSHLTRESIDQMIETIEQFPKFFGALSLLKRNEAFVVLVFTLPGQEVVITAVILFRKGAAGFGAMLVDGAVSHGRV
jgi:hypothetical protein